MGDHYRCGVRDMIPADVLSSAQLFQGLYRLNRLGEIHRPTRVTTATGFTSGWAPVAVSLPMGVAQGQGGQSNEEREIIARLGAVVAFILLVPIDTDVRITDRVYLTTGPESPRTFEVVGVPNRGVSYETLRRVIAVETK